MSLSVLEAELRRVKRCIAAQLRSPQARATHAAYVRDYSRRMREKRDPAYLARRRGQKLARRAREHRATSWSDRALVKDIYAYARIMREHGVDCEVDHMEPLNGRLVSGLHTDANLTVLLAEHNRAKGATH
jgi:hypothetical protein